MLSLAWLPARDFLVVSGTSIIIWEFRKDLVEEYKAQVKREKAAANLVAAVQSKQARQDYENERMKKEEKRRASLFRAVWRTQCTAPTAHIACSPDGRFFATAGKHDKVVKVWFARPNRAQAQGDKENAGAGANGAPKENGHDAESEKRADSDDEEDKDEKRERSMLRWTKKWVLSNFFPSPHSLSYSSFIWFYILATSPLSFEYFMATHKRDTQYEKVNFAVFQNDAQKIGIRNLELRIIGLNFKSSTLNS